MNLEFVWITLSYERVPKVQRGFKRSSMKETGLACPNCFIHGGWGCIPLTRLNQRLNTFWMKGCPGKEVHWLNTWGLSSYPISMRYSIFYATMTSCHVPFSGVLWSRAWGQEPGQELIWTPAILNYEIYCSSELPTTLPVLLSGGTIHCLTMEWCLLHSAWIFSLQLPRLWKCHHRDIQNMCLLVILNPIIFTCI